MWWRAGPTQSAQRTKADLMEVLRVFPASQPLAMSSISPTKHSLDQTWGDEGSMLAITAAGAANGATMSKPVCQAASRDQWDTATEVLCENGEVGSRTHPLGWCVTRWCTICHF